MLTVNLSVIQVFMLYLNIKMWLFFLFISNGSMEGRSMNEHIIYMIQGGKLQHVSDWVLEAPSRGEWFQLSGSDGRL